MQSAGSQHRSISCSYNAKVLRRMDSRPPALVSSRQIQPAFGFEPPSSCVGTDGLGP